MNKGRTKRVSPIGESLSFEVLDDPQAKIRLQHPTTVASSYDGWYWACACGQGRDRLAPDLARQMAAMHRDDPSWPRLFNNEVTRSV